MDNNTEMKAGQTASDQREIMNPKMITDPEKTTFPEKTANPEELTLEEAFQRLDALSARLEDRDIPREEAFDLYRQGMELLKTCSGKIDTVEKKMLEITEDGEIREFQG